MRLAPFLLFLALAGVPSGLEARPAQKVVPTVHKVRRGETAAKIARANGLTLQQLEDLNPKVNLAKLSVGTALRVKGKPVPKAGPKIPVAEVASVDPNAVIPVAPIPAIPAKGPAVLVHLERLIPTSMDEPSARKPIRSLAPLTAEELVPVFPPNSGLEYESRVAGELGFEPADPSGLDLLWPVATRSISSSWGPRMRTRTVRIVKANKNRKVRVRYQGSHKGVDLTAPTGTDVYAAQDGRVIVARRDSGYGNYLILDHGNGVQTLYAHNSRLFAQVGDLAQRGQKIAEVGRTGHATGPHLHFELRLQGQPQNPLPVLNDVEELPAEMIAFNELITPPRK